MLVALTASPSAFAEPALGSRSAGDGWIVRVSVEPSDLGPIEVSVGPVRRAPESCSRCCAPAWLQHDVVFENTGSRPVTFSGLGIAARLGPRGRPVLLVAGPPCGYGNSKRRIELACLMYRDVPTLEPHGSHTRAVTLWKGLRGMKGLSPGTYAFDTTIRFQAGRRPPAEGAGRTATLRIVYRVAAV
jgi:hypothetical protein